MEGKSDSVLVEVCVDSVESALAAKAGGADRLEVCGSLAAGGVTPSFGLVEQCVADVQLPSMMMIRPHDGGFVYSPDDVDTMLTDIEVAKSIGVQGIVFGPLTSDGDLDLELTRKVLDAADGLETTFHRAIDVAADPYALLEKLIELGVTRVLTSGQAASALEGVECITQLQRLSAGKIQVLPGAGINESNVVELVRRCDVGQVHASGSVPLDNDVSSNGVVQFGGSRRVTSADKIRAIKTSLATLN